MSKSHLKLSLLDFSLIDREDVQLCCVTVKIDAYIGGQDSLLTKVLPSHKDIVSKGNYIVIIDALYY